MAEDKSVLQPTSDDARRQAKTLIRSARYGALATLDAPQVTRVGVSTDFDGAPVLLISGLAAHFPALKADGRCSLLLGETGKGDPLAHPRISIAAEARILERNDSDSQRIAARYLAHQPKAKLYAELGDFRFVRLEPRSASLNGGFGKAFNLSRADLINSPEMARGIALSEQDDIDDLNSKLETEIGLHAKRHNEAAGRWKITSLDPDGFNLSNGDHIIRSHFPVQADSGDVALKMLTDALKTDD
jgi:putative heme iron utilization protein